MSSPRRSAPPRATPSSARRTGSESGSTATGDRQFRDQGRGARVDRPLIPSPPTPGRGGPAGRMRFGPSPTPKSAPCGGSGSRTSGRRLADGPSATPDAETSLTAGLRRPRAIPTAPVIAVWRIARGELAGALRDAARAISVLASGAKQSSDRRTPYALAFTNTPSADSVKVAFTVLATINASVKLAKANAPLGRGSG